MQSEKLAGVRDVIIENECAWMIADSVNWLLKYSFLRNELELEAAFPKAIGTNWGAFSKIVRVGNEIYLSPFTAKDAYCYNLDEKMFQKLNFPLNGCKKAKNIRMVVREKDIYFVNRSPDMVIKVDSVTKSIQVFEAENDCFINQKAENKIYRSYLNPEVYDNKILWSSYNNILNIFDMKNESFSIEKLTDVLNGKVKWTKDIFGEEQEDWLIGLKVFQDRLWFLSYGGNIFQYNGKMNKVENRLFNDYVCKEIEGSVRAVFSDILVLDNELWFIPQYKKKCIRYCADNDSFERIMDSYVQEWDVQSREYVGCKVVGAGKILLYSYYERCFFILDTEKDVISKEEIKISFGKFARENKAFRQTVMKGSCVLFDNIEFLLEDIAFQAEKPELPDSAAGKRIYAFLSMDSKESL